VREEVKRETWLEGGWARVVTVVLVLFVVWTGELLLAVFGGAELSTVDSLAALFALVASLGLLAAVSKRKLPRNQWVMIGFAYMLFLVAAAAVGRHEGEMVARGWPGGAILVILFPVMFPAPGRAALAFGLAGWAADIAVAFHYGRTPADFGGWVGLYHGYLMGTIFSVALAYLQRRIGQTEITSSNLGSYNLVEKLGEGGMGEVWRADHTLLKRGAAVKLIHPKRARDPKSAVAYRKRFEREVQSASRLRSPYTVEIFDYGEREDGVLWFAMELIDGLDMVELTFRNRPLHIERIVHLLSQVCHSLEEAHEHGLVHRDIKPNNVMVGRMGAEYDFVKVLDFGLVKLEETKEDVKLTRAGATPGTPGFMAPEQIMTPSEVDPRADIYSVGCLAYFLVTGRLVFEADDWERVKMAHVKNPVVPPSDRTDFDVPAEMDAVIMKCLEKDPDDRFQTIGKLAEALAAVPVEEPWTRARAKKEWTLHKFKSSDWTLSD